MRSTIGFTVLALALGAGAAPAQQPLTAGQRVRITSAQYHLNLKVATLVAVDDSTVRVALTKYLTVNPRDLGITDTVALLRAGVDRIEVSQAQTRATGTGAVIGFVSGAVVGGLIGAASYREKECGPPNPGIGVVCISPPWSRGSIATAGAATLGLIGAGIGALIGSATHRERWEAVVSGPTPQRFGAGLGLGIRF